MLKPGLIGLAALLLTAAAPLIQGDPIPDRDIVLEEDPGNLTVSGATDRSGGVLLSAQPGRYALKLPNAQTLRVPAVARVEIGRMVLTTSTIQPGGRGDAYFMGRDGRRLTFMVPRGARVRVLLTEGAPVGGGGGSTRVMPVYNPDGSIVHPEAQAGPGGPGRPVGPLPDLPAQADRDFDGIRLRAGTANQDGGAETGEGSGTPNPERQTGTFDVREAFVEARSRTDQESPPAVTDPRIPPPAPRPSGMEP